MIIGLVESTAVQASRPDTGTSQNLFVHQALNGGWYLASRSNAATREGVGDLFFGYIDLSLGRKLTPNWSVDIGYRHAWLEIGDEWRDEFRPLLNVAWRDRTQGWSLGNRHRLELRVFEGTARHRTGSVTETRRA